MSKKALLWILCIFCCFAGLAWAEEPVTETLPEAVETVATAEAEIVESVELPEALFWIGTDTETCDVTVGAEETDLSNRGGCNTNIRCNSTLTCIQRCPFNVGFCTRAGCCICAT